MGLFAIIARSLGLVPPLQPREPEPFRLTAAARRRIASLPDGTALNLATRPDDEGGFALVIHEGAPISPLTEAPGAPVSIAPDQLQRLAGLQLDWDGSAWAPRVDLEVQADETPNPDGRLYETDRLLVLGRPLFFLRGRDARVPVLARRLFQVEGVHSLLFREHTVTVEREPGAAWALLDREVQAALKRHFLRCGEPLDPDTLPERDDPLEAAVARVIEERIQPAVHRDGGNIALVDVHAGVVRVQLTGACRTCPAASLTLKAGVERTLKEALPGEIQRVEAI